MESVRSLSVIVSGARRMPFLLIALGGLGAVLGFKWYKQEASRIAAELREAELALKRSDDQGVMLERDPATGVYRPGVRNRT